MPDTTLQGYKLTDRAPTTEAFAQPEPGTLFGYPAPMIAESVISELPAPAATEILDAPAFEPTVAAAMDRVEPGSTTSPAPAMSDFAFDSLPPPPESRPAMAPPVAAIGPLPVAVISDGVAGDASLAWNDDAAPSGPVDVWGETKDDANAASLETFEDDEPQLVRKPAVRSSAPLGWIAAGVAGVFGVAGVAAALFLFAGSSDAPEARMIRPARAPTAVAAAQTPAAVAPVTPVEAPVVTNIPVPPAAAAPATPAPTPVAPTASGATASRAPARATTSGESTTAIATTPRRSRRAASSSGPSLDAAPMASGEGAPAFDLGNALAPLMGAQTQPAAPGSQATGSLDDAEEEDDSLAALRDRAQAVGGQRDSEPTISAPPPMAAAPRPGDEIDWGVPFGG